MNNNHVLKQTHVGDVMVSTISLIALDLGIAEIYPPAGEDLLELHRHTGSFETMVFGPGDHDEQYRYETVEEALQHHDDLVKQLELMLP